MINKEIVFPVYRKLFNGKSLYEITSFREMTEIQFVGGRIDVFAIVADKYPEKLLIKDIISLNNGVYIEITFEEFEILKQKKREA